MILSARRPAVPAAPPPVTEPSPSADELEALSDSGATVEHKPRPRSARIVSAAVHDPDGRKLERERLLARLLSSEGRGAVTRAADQYLRAGFEFPVDQPTQLQLLEHLDESLVRCAMEALRGIVVSEPPLKRPILEQRLKRLEDSGEEEATRVAATDLRRVLRN